MLVGLMSDTHGLLRSEAVAALSGVDIIVHAGDIGSGTMLPALRQIVPSSRAPVAVQPRELARPMALVGLRHTRQASTATAAQYHHTLEHAP